MGGMGLRICSHPRRLKMSHYPFSPLHALTEALHRQNETLGKDRNAYLSLEAERKHFEANLIRSSVGMGTSHAQATTMAQSTGEWLEFHKKLARAEAVYEFQKLKFTIMEKE